MKLKELTVMLTKKVSENYDSKGVSVGLAVTLEEGDDKDKEYAALVSWCAEKIAGTLKAHGALPSQPVLPNTPDAKPAPVAQSAQQGGLLEDVPEDWCPIHNCQMDKRPKGWKPGDDYWFSHSTGKDETTGKYIYCRGK